MSQTIGIVSVLKNKLTARKVGYIRRLSDDNEIQADLWRKECTECVGAFLKESIALSKWAEKRLKKLEKKEQQEAEAARKAAIKARRNGLQPRSKEEVKASVEKARKEKAILAKSKGRGFKPLKKDRNKEKERLLAEARKLRSILAEKARKEREEKRKAEEAARREQDRLRTEAYKAKLLKEKQERNLWNQREQERQERLIQKYAQVGEVSRRVVLPPKKKEDQEVINLQKEIARYKKELGLQ